MYSSEYFENQLVALVGFRFWKIGFRNVYKVVEGEKNPQHFLDTCVLIWPMFVKYNLPLSSYFPS